MCSTRIESHLSDVDQAYTQQMVRRGLRMLPQLRELYTISGGARGALDGFDRIRQRDLLVCFWIDVEAALQRLPPILRQAVYYRYDRSMNEEDAARQLGICRKVLQRRLQLAEETIACWLVHVEPRKKVLKFLRKWSQNSEIITWMGYRGQ